MIDSALLVPLKSCLTVSFVMPLPFGGDVSIPPRFLEQNYVAPEVMKGKYHPASADMWSLGVVVYFLMSSTLPFNAGTTDMIKQKVLGKPG